MEKVRRVALAGVAVRAPEAAGGAVAALPAGIRPSRRSARAGERSSCPGPDTSKLRALAGELSGRLRTIDEVGSVYTSGGRGNDELRVEPSPLMLQAFGMTADEVLPILGIVRREGVAMQTGFTLLDGARCPSSCVASSRRARGDATSRPSRSRPPASTFPRRVRRASPRARGPSDRAQGRAARDLGALSPRPEQGSRTGAREAGARGAHPGEPARDQPSLRLHHHGQRARRRHEVVPGCRRPRAAPALRGAGHHLRVADTADPRAARAPAHPDRRRVDPAALGHAGQHDGARRSALPDGADRQPRDPARRSHEDPRAERPHERWRGRARPRCASAPDPC